jgi:zeaxanthin glucosyltransferase
MHATFKLAKDLVGSGHDVYYLGIPDCEPYVTLNGLRFVPMFAQCFPKGYMAFAWKRSSLAGVRKLVDLRKSTPLVESVFAFLMDKGRHEFKNVVKDLQPSICIVGSAYFESTVWALLAHNANVRCVYLNSTFVRSEDRIIPPVSTRIIPDGTYPTRMKTNLAWKSHLLRKRGTDGMRALLGLGPNWPRTFRLLAAKCNYPANSLNFRDLISPRLPLPELVLWPREFDFPEGDRENRYYIGPSIDLERQEMPFPWEMLDSKKRLVYCALGGLPFLKQTEYKAFFQRVIDASSVRKDWQWVLALGENLKCEEFGSMPENVILVQRAPQLAILKQAHLMITHGGANSVKEGIFFAVPMIVFPMGFDHPGIAARLAAQGVGVVGTGHKASVHEIRSLVEKVDRNPGFHAQARRLSQTFQQAEATALGVRALEAMIPISGHEKGQAQRCF